MIEIKCDFNVCFRALPLKYNGVNSMVQVDISSAYKLSFTFLWQLKNER